MSNVVGVQVSAYFRAMLNHHADVDWRECEKIGKIFDSYLMEADWLALDNGTTFEKTFVPTWQKEKKRQREAWLNGTTKQV